MISAGLPQHQRKNRIQKRLVAVDLNVFPGLGLRFKENILGCVYLGRVIYVNMGILNRVSADPHIPNTQTHARRFALPVSFSAKSAAYSPH